MGNDEQEKPQPPQPPEINRKVTFYPVQIIVMCLIAAVPLLALLGVFGLRSETVSGQDAAFSLQVEYPRLFRFKTDGHLNITVQNTSGQALDGVIVRVSADYISAFSKVSFAPEISQITPATYEVAVGAMQPNESRVVSIEVEGNEVGQHEGVISVSMPDAEPLEVIITTLVFP